MFQIVLWNRIGISLGTRIHQDPDPDQFADDKPKYMEYQPIWALFQGF